MGNVWLRENHPNRRDAIPCLAKKFLRDASQVTKNTVYRSGYSLHVTHFIILCPVICFAQGLSRRNLGMPSFGHFYRYQFSLTILGA